MKSKPTLLDAVADSDSGTGDYSTVFRAFLAAPGPVLLGAPSSTPPQGGDSTVAIPTHYALHLSNFGFSDVDGNAFVGVRITTLPGAGTLYYDANGALGGGRSAVTAGQTISAADINAGKLTFVAAPGGSGPGTPASPSRCRTAAARSAASISIPARTR